MRIPKGDGAGGFGDLAFECGKCGVRLGAAFKNLLGQIAFGGVGDQGGDSLAWAEALCNLDGRVDHGAGTGAGEQAFLGSEGFDGGKGVGIGYSPSMKCRSLWHRPVNAVRSRTSCAAGLAISRFSIANG